MIARYPMVNMDSTIRFIRSESKYLISYSCWWAIYCIALLTPLFSQAISDSQFRLDFNGMSVLSGAIVSILLAMSNGFAITKRPKQSTIVAIFCIEGGLAASYFMFIQIGGFLLGVGISLLQILWGVIFFSKLRAKEIYIATVVPIAIGSIVAFVIVLFGSVASAILAFVLPLGVSIGIFAIETINDRSTNPTKHIDDTIETESNRAMIGPIILTTCFGLAFGIFRTILLPEHSHFEILTFGATVLSCCVAGILVLAISLCLSRSSRVPLALGMTLFAVTAAVFVLSLLESEGKSIAQAIITGGFRCVDIITWIMLLLSISGSSALTSVRAFALWRGLGCLGCYFGYLMGDIIVEHSILDSIGLVPISILLLLFLMAATAISLQFFRQTDITGNTAEPIRDNLATSYEAISRQYKLSKREAQVFELLCSGRSVPYIAEKLVIAPSTVTTHVQRIYRKLDVHNKQELIDFAERNRTEQDEHLP